MGAGGVPEQALSATVSAMDAGVVLVTSLWNGSPEWLGASACGGKWWCDIAQASFALTDFAMDGAAYTSDRILSPFGEGELRKDPLFQPVDKGMNRACRGANETDEVRTYFTLYSGVHSLDLCKRLCARNPVCKGIEYSLKYRRCEVWTRAGGIQTSVPFRDFTCLRYMPREAEPGLAVQAYAKRSILSFTGPCPGRIFLIMAAVVAWAAVSMIAVEFWRSRPSYSLGLMQQVRALRRPRTCLAVSLHHVIEDSERVPLQRVG